MSERRQSFLSRAFLTEVRPLDRVNPRELDQHPELEREVGIRERRFSRLYATGFSFASVNKEDAMRLFAEKSKIASTIQLANRRMSQLSDMQLNEAVQKIQVENQDEKTEFMRRKHRKVLESITYVQADDYYEHTPLKPGIAFFRSFLPLAGRTESRLKVLMPRSVLVFDDLYSAEWAEDRSEEVVTEQFKMSDFYHQVQNTVEASVPVAVRRLPDSRNIASSKVALLTTPELFEALFKTQLPHSGIFQELLPSHVGQPSIIRLFYIPCTKSGKASYAFQINSTDEGMAKYPMTRFVVSTSQWDAFEVFKQTGKSLSNALSYGETIVSYLEWVHSVKFEEIVLDFIVDARDRMWLISCKGFSLDMQMLQARTLRLKEAEEDPEAAALRRKLTIEERLSPMHCKLCLLPVKSAEMEHVMPFKMLLLYKYHSARRGKSVIDLSHLRVNTVDYLTHWVRLCNLCHILVQSEYELFETECQLGNLLSVPVKSPEILGNPVYHYPNFMPQSLHQWRILFYFDRIEWEQYQHSYSPLYLHFSWFGDTFSSRADLHPTAGQETVLNCARLFTYFAARDKGSTEYAKNLQLAIRLTHTASWDHPVLTATCRPLSLFANLVAEERDITNTFVVPLYDDCEIVGRLKIALGHACDKAVVLRELQANLERFGSLFIPDMSFMSGDLLPNSWLEAFDKDYKAYGEKTVILDATQEMERRYSPILTNREILSVPSSSTKVLHLNVELYPQKRGHRRTRTSPASKTQRVCDHHHVELPLKQWEKRYRAKKDRPLTTRRTAASPFSNTTASSGILYSVDTRTRLKSPTFLPSRVATAPQSLEDSTIEKDSLELEQGEVSGSESLERLEEMIPDVPTQANWDSPRSPQIADTVAAYLRRRHISTNTTPLRGAASDKKKPSRRKVHKHTLSVPSLQKMLVRAYSTPLRVAEAAKTPRKR